MKYEDYKCPAYEVDGGLKVGDVVHAEGAAGILGDVVEVDIDRDEEDPSDMGMVRVAWRASESTEIQQELYLLERDEPKPAYRLWVDESRQTLVRMWRDGRVEVAHRRTAQLVWDPPLVLTEEQV